MNEFENLNDLRQAWASGNFDFPDQTSIAGIPYKYRKSYNEDFIDIVQSGIHPFVIYSTSDSHKDQAEKVGMKQWIVFIWGTPDNAKILPYDIRTTTSARFVGRQVTEQQETIGDVAILKIMLPSGVGVIKGKVDTGAELCSLHADQMKVVGDQVRFINKDLSNNAIQVPLADKQAVSSADGGVEYRPVIELDIEINGKRVSKALFNLNDRSQMEYPVLVGQNVLEKTGFLVDPRQNGDPQTEGEEWVEDELLESVNIEAVKEFAATVEPTINLNEEIDYEALEQVYAMLRESKFTFEDLIRHIKTEAIQIVSKTEY